MRRFLNNRISNYNNVGDKVDDFCEDCENRWLPFSRVWWDSTEKNIANIKRKDNGIFVIKKILSLINSISESIKDIYDRINVIDSPILSEKLLELENDYLEVGVTADDKQEDLNIAIYENYINLKNTKVNKPLIESTSDSLKIVALDNQGESVFIKSNELGKVKSVNNKIGDVILKTSDLENDSDYTTNLKLNKEIDERISGDNLKLDKPTTSGTTTTHPNIVGVDDLGNSAKLKATDFGKVKSVNGKEGDVILKTSDLENDSDYTTNDTLTAHTSNKANPHNVTKEQLGLGNVDNTSDLNKPIPIATQIELNKKVNSVNGINPDNNKNIKVGINEILKEYQPNIVADKNKKVLLFDEDGKTYYFNLGNIITNTSVDESLFVNVDNLLGVNTTSAITEKVINIFENITYPIDISLDYDYTEISDIFINSCLKLPRDYYYIISNNRIKIKDFSDLINTENWEKLFIEITGTKNINYEQ